MLIPRLVRSAALKEGRRLRAGRLGRGPVRRDATGVANVKVEALEEIDVFGD